MPKSATVSLYDEVIRVTRFYFGPTTKRLVDRQIINHLGIRPEQLAKRDLAKLTDWMCLTLALVAEDENLVDSYNTDLRSLTSK